MLDVLILLLVFVLILVLLPLCDGCGAFCVEEDGCDAEGGGGGPAAAGPLRLGTCEEDGWFVDAFCCCG